MQKRKLILAGIGCLIIFVAACVVSAAIFYLARGRVKEVLKSARAGKATASSSLYGSYDLVSESSGWHPAAKARVVLNFIPPGTVALRATRPGESLTDVGTFSVSGSSMTLKLPETGKAAVGASYAYDGKTLTLPIQIFSDSPGTSVWKRINTAPDPLRDAVQNFFGRAAREGRGPAIKALVDELKANPAVSAVKVSGTATVLVTYRGGYQEFFLAPPVQSGRGGPARSSGQGGMLRRPGCSGGAGGQVLLAQFLPQGPPQVFAGGNSSEAAWLANEPEPVSHGDAPPERTALILGAFHTLPVLIPGTDRYHYFTFADKGENLEVLKGYLEHARYQVDGPHIDRDVTVKLLYEKLKNSRWGVFFFSTHGGILPDDAILSTGEEVPVPFSITPETRKEFLDRYFADYLDESVGGGIGREAYQDLRDSIMVGFMYDDVPFVAVKSRFFRAVGADFSRSLVYLSACESAETNDFRDAMQPRSFAGWSAEVDMELGADMNQQFFRCLSRRTRSDREAYEFAVKNCLGNHHWEQRWKAAGGAEKPLLDARHFVVIRQGKSRPEAFFTVNQFMMIHTVREWVCQRKGGKGLQESVNALYECKQDESHLTTPEFCKKAFNFMEVPRSQIDEVKDELCGGAPSRFTLEER